METERPLLNRQQRRAAEILLKADTWQRNAKKVEKLVLEVELKRRYTEEAVEETYGSPLD